jgi:maleate isomerase
MIIPSSNSVVEQVAPRLLPQDGSVTFHFSRFRVRTISDQLDSSRQFDLEAPLAAAALLADVHPDLILWNGTAASWLGFDYDHRLIAGIEAATAVPATSAVQAINGRLSQLGATRIGLVTPYIAALEAAIIENYRTVGIKTISAVRKDVTENTAYARIGAQDLADMVRAAAGPKPDAIVIMCTNLAGAEISAPLGEELGIPVLDSVRVAVESALQQLGSLDREGPRGMAAAQV